MAVSNVPSITTFYISPLISAVAIMILLLKYIAGSSVRW